MNGGRVWLPAPSHTDRDGHSTFPDGRDGTTGPDRLDGADVPAVTGIDGALLDMPPTPRLWQHPALRWVAIGGLVSMLGDQFTLLAMPWLLLSLTTDPLALGAVMAVMGLPQAVLMLVGGAVVERSGQPGDPAQCPQCRGAAGHDPGGDSAQVAAG